MASKKATEAVETAEVIEAVEVAQETVKKFPVSNLAKNCAALFGVSSSVFAGATANLTGDSYSVEEMKSIINGWCGKVVK